MTSLRPLLLVFSLLLCLGYLCVPVFGSEEIECSQEERLKKLVEKHRLEDPGIHPLPYDPYDCPKDPPPYYPPQWDAARVMKNWRHNDTEIPESIHQALCVFDYIKDYDKAMRYRDMDVPFVIRNRPEVTETADKWHEEAYMAKLLEDPTRNYMMHTSNTPQFLYWDLQRKEYPNGYVPPSTTQRVSYKEYLNLTERVDTGNDLSYHYLMVEGYWSTSDPKFRWHVFDELPMFKPAVRDMFNEVVHTDYQKLHCKFHRNQKGTRAVMHFDSGANLILLLQGQRRILLADPTQCTALNLRQIEHPSVRHTQLDFNNLDADNSLKLNEVVMQAGDALFLPSYWFHDLTSLSDDMAQCAAWSTATLNRKQIIQQCGSFGV